MRKRVIVPYSRTLFAPSFSPFNRALTYRFCFMRFVNEYRCISPSSDQLYSLPARTIGDPTGRRNERSHHFNTYRCVNPRDSHARAVRRNRVSRDVEIKKMKESSFAFSRRLLARRFSLLLAFHAPWTKPRLS